MAKRFQATRKEVRVTKIGRINTRGAERRTTCDLRFQTIDRGGRVNKARRFFKPIDLIIAPRTRDDEPAEVITALPPPDSRTSQCISIAFARDARRNEALGRQLP